jgi:hypothetical protein
MAKYFGEKLTGQRKNYMKSYLCPKFPKVSPPMRRR